MVQDPGGLLQRIPELKPLCEDPGVLRAVERGDSFRLYRALLWARWLGRLRSHRPLLDSLLEQRRLFARPIKGGPFLATLNGFGATLLGDADPDYREGTHIATHWLVALFVIPLLPLGAYVVRPAEDNGLRHRSWQVFARVPLGPLPWLWGRALALGVMALVLLGALKTLRDSRSHEVRLLNGFAQPVSVEFAGRSRTIPPHDMLVLESFPLGHYKGRAVAENGDEVDTVELDVRKGDELILWNIAGAAPVYIEDVDSSSSKPHFYCGRQVLPLRGITYAFREPPDSMELSSSTSGLPPTHVGVAPQDDASPLPLCLRVLAAEDRLAGATQLIEAAARVSGWEPDLTSQLLGFALRVDSPKALRIAELAIEARPEDLELHRIYQRVAERVGSFSALLEEYRARAEAKPDSFPAQYLYARLQTGRDGAARLEQLAQRFPQEPALLRSLAFSRVRAGDWQGAIQAWKTLHTLSAKDATDIAQTEATALVALGRRQEALELLKKLFAKASPRQRHGIATLHARVARASEGTSPEELISELEAENESAPGEKLWLLRAQASLPIEEAPDRPDLRLMSTIGWDPHAALEHAARLAPFEPQDLRRDSWALAYGEAVRTHDDASEQTLAQADILDTHSTHVFRRFVLGEPVSLDEADLDPEVRAAARFVRSRNETLSAEERRQLVEQARQDDWFHGAVSEAIASWAP